MKLDLSEQEQELYDSWDKEKIYLAYVHADTRTKKAVREIKRLGRVIAGLEFDIKQLKDKSHD